MLHLYGPITLRFGLKDLLFIWQIIWIFYTLFSPVQFSCSVVTDSLRPHEQQHARPPCPSPAPGVHSDSTSIECVMPSSHLILCRPLLLLPPIPPSIRIFSNESTLRMRWPKYWNFSFSIIPSKETPGLISFRMDWLDLLADCLHGHKNKTHIYAIYNRLISDSEHIQTESEGMGKDIPHKWKSKESWSSNTYTRPAKF